MNVEQRDLIRELEKAERVLSACERHFMAAAEANAALHMSERVIPNPLASSVALTRKSLEATIDALREKP